MKSVKTCDTCKHYSQTMRCKLFGKVSLYSGAVFQATVSEARTDDHCGFEGRYWEPTTPTRTYSLRDATSSNCDPQPSEHS